jgi:hypothetical protein
MEPFAAPGLSAAPRPPVPHSVLHVDVWGTPKVVLMQPLVAGQHLALLLLLPEATA